MKLFILILCLFSTQTILANDAFVKKCIELKGETGAPNDHGSCKIVVKVENKQSNPNILTSAGDYVEEQRATTDILNKACSDAADGNPNAIVSMNYFLSNNSELNIGYFCFITID